MSLKENVSAVKEQLSSEEKFFEKLINLEYFYKKFKVYIWAAVFVVVAYVGYVIISSYVEQNRIDDANKAYNMLQENPGNQEARTKLQQNSPALYDLFLYSQAVQNSDSKLFEQLKTSKHFAIADMAQYNYAMLNDDKQALNDYIDSNGIYFKDLAILQQAVALVKEDKISQAHDLLQGIGQNSVFYPQAEVLLHYGIAK